MPTQTPGVWSYIGKYAADLTGASDIPQVLPESVKQGLKTAEEVSRPWTGTSEERVGAAAMMPYFIIPGAIAPTLAKIGVTSPHAIQTLQGAMSLGYHKALQATGIEHGKPSDMTWQDALLLAMPYLAPTAKELAGKVLGKASAAGELQAAKDGLGKIMKLEGMSDKEILRQWNAAQETPPIWAEGGARPTPPSGGRADTLPEPPVMPGEYNRLPIKEPVTSEFGESNPFADTSELPTAQMTQPEIPVGSPSPVADQYLKSATDYARNRLIHRAADTVNADKIRGMNDEQVRQLYRQIEVEPYKDYLPGDSQAPTQGGR